MGAGFLDRLREDRRRIDFMGPIDPWDGRSFHQLRRAVSRISPPWDLAIIILLALGLYAAALAGGYLVSVSEASIAGMFGGFLMVGVAAVISSRLANVRPVIRLG
jgi:hypothetical protein